ncbi:MAG: hypothetical protein JXK93_07410, partial [Sphaerochaetaceae bacterium]|nr:hypothetical protein [Sphaerochaetaceae bacterium]
MMKDTAQNKKRPAEFKRLLIRTIDVILLLSSFVLLLFSSFIVFTLLPVMNEMDPSDGGGTAFNNALLSLVA